MRIFAVAFSVFSVSPSFGQAFLGLGFVGTNTHSQASAISADGTTVVGGSLSTPWRWTLSSGMQTLGSAPPGYVLLPANDVSSNGSTIVGGMTDGIDAFAWRWTQTSGVQRVVGVGATFGPYISSDASTIVGQGQTGGGVRWTETTGVQSLGPVTGLPFGNGSTFAGYAASANGSVIVGPAFTLYQLNPPLETVTPFRWTESTGAVGILNNGQLYTPLDGSGARSVSADGQRIAGYSGRSAWLWSAAIGYQTLVLNPAPVAGQFSPSISGDGMTVAYREFLWTQSNGTQLLSNVLASAGCNFTGWSDLRVIDTSFDGRTLCGYGTNPSGQTEAWYATIPTPSSAAALLGLGGAGLIRRRRRFIAQLSTPSRLTHSSLSQ